MEVTYIGVGGRMPAHGMKTSREGGVGWISLSSVRLSVSKSTLFFEQKSSFFVSKNHLFLPIGSSFVEFSTNESFVA